MRKTMSPVVACSRLLSVAVVILLTAPLQAQSAAPTFSKAFAPDTIGPGSQTTLRYAITNNANGAVTGLSFSEILPSGVMIASPARARTTCGQGVLTALAGETTISLAEGTVGAGSSCTVTVNVAAQDPGAYTAVSGDLSSSAGNSGSSSADLNVVTERPGFTKTFSPWSVRFGSRATLTLTIDNSLNDSAASGLTFTDTLPNGMRVANPPNASTSCDGGVLSTPAGGNTVSYSPAFFGDAGVAAGAACTISVDVVAGAVGWLENTTGELVSFSPQFAQRTSGKAGESLNVTIEALSLVKDFTDDPAAPGETVNVTYTIRNINRSSAASNITFTDDLDAALSGLAASDLPAEPCGSGSSLSGNGVLTFAGGELGPGESCSFTALLTIPSTASSGAYTSATSEISAEIDATPITAAGASELLFVAPVPRLTKSFIGDPVGAGGSVVLEFTLTNSSTTSDATDIAFTDMLDVILPTASVVPADGFCGPDSTAAFTPLSGFSTASLVASGMSLGPAESCTFSLTLDIANGASAGFYSNTTTDVTATVDGTEIIGPPASDELEIVAAPVLRKEFIDDPVPAGGTVTMQFTLSHDGLSGSDATAITFTDDLEATLSGLVATGLPVSDVCGTGSQISGTSNLTFSGGTLAPGEDCTFSVSLSVPATVTPGRHTNTTSAVQADVAGITAHGSPGSDDLRIAGLTMVKSFTDDPVLPGGNVTLEFTITNSDPSTTATGISFLDDLGDVLAGLTAIGLPANDVCGAGSSLSAVSGNTLLLFSGGTLAAGESCTFSASLAVPANADSGTYVNRTENLQATFGGETILFENATDLLTIDAEILSFSKEFIDDPVSPGGAVTLRFTVTNLHLHLGISELAFTDDLEAVIPGLAASGLPSSGCGGTVSGTSTISLAGGTLAPASSCTFDVTLSVPGVVTPGTIATNVTSPITGASDGISLSGAPASDDLQINFLEFTKSFSGPASAGGTVDLTFNIRNLSDTEAADEMSFADNLSAVLTGLVATGTPVQDVCGTGSELTGTAFLTLLGGNLLPGGSCTFSVSLDVPESALPGSYLNSTSSLREGSAPAAPPATAVLTVIGTTDEDRDGVPDNLDACPGTAIPEGVPTRELRPNHYALVDEDTTFDTVQPNGNGPRETFTTEDTAGCSCEQIIDRLELGEGHRKFGCSLGVMREWISSLN